MSADGIMYELFCQKLSLGPQNHYDNTKTNVNEFLDANEIIAR